MISQERILHVIGSLYDAANECSAEGWQTAYVQMADLFSSGPGTLNLYSQENDQPSRITSTASEECLKAFDTRFKDISPIQKKVLQTAVGETYWRLRDCPDRDFVNTEFYQDFALKERMFDIAYIKLCRRSGMDAGITFTRPKTMPFTDDDLKSMRVLIPNLQRAVQIFLMIADLHAENMQVKEVIAKSPRGVILLDKGCKPIYRNPVAEQIIAKKDGIEIDRKGMLFAKNAQETNDLKRTLNSVFDGRSGPSGRGGFLHVSRPSGLRPFQLHISPLPSKNFAGYSPGKAALLFICDPEYRIETFEDTLREMYRFTPAEARLVAMLTQGLSLKDAESILGVQPSTIRTHMKRIFSKTNCKRQGELITLVNNGLAALRLL